jgi:hypothetical protein
MQCLKNDGSAAPTGSWRTITPGGIALFDPCKVRIERYWYRGTLAIPSPYPTRRSLHRSSHTAASWDAGNALSSANDSAPRVR